MVCPSCDAKEISARHDFIAFFQQPQLLELTKSLQAELQRVGDIPRAVRRVSSRCATPKDWIGLMESVLGALEIGRILEVMIRYTDAEKTNVPELAAMTPELLRSGAVSQLALLLQQVIDAKQTLEQKEVVVREGVDAQLDEQRHLYSSLLSILNECTAASKHVLLQRIPELASLPTFDCWGYEFHPLSAATVADSWIVGYVLSVPISTTQEIGTDPATFTSRFIPSFPCSNSRFPPDFEYQFHTEDTLYYKTDIALDLDSNYGDLHSIIADIQDSILSTLAKKLVSLSTMLCDVAGTVAEIDVLSSWAAICADCGFVRPTLSDEPVICVTVCDPPNRE